MDVTFTPRQSGHAGARALWVSLIISHLLFIQAALHGQFAHAHHHLPHHATHPGHLC